MVNELNIIIIQMSWLKMSENFNLWVFCENVLKKLYNESNFRGIWNTSNNVSLAWLFARTLKLKCRHYCALAVVVPSVCACALEPTINSKMSPDNGEDIESFSNEKPSKFSQSRKTRHANVIRMRSAKLVFISSSDWRHEKKNIW